MARLDVPVLELQEVWGGLRGTPLDQRLARLLALTGTTFSGPNQRFTKNGPNVALLAFGGVPVVGPGESLDDAERRLEATVQATHQVMGCAAALSYLNPKDKELGALYDQVTGLGHFSVAHHVSVTFVATNITETVARELFLQRDRLVFASLTSARTGVQSRPPLVLSEEVGAPSEALRAFVDRCDEASAEWRALKLGPDGQEAGNGLYPLNKASALMVTGSLRSWQHVCALCDDEGKENGLRKLAAEFGTILSRLWPELFAKFVSRDEAFFAASLTAQVDTVEPLALAMAAQQAASQRGFDFSSIQELLARSRSELQEVRAALAKQPIDLAALADEVADLVFSFVNLGRFRAHSVALTVAEAERRPAPGTSSDLQAIERLMERMVTVPQHEVGQVFESGVVACIQFAKGHGISNLDAICRRNVSKFLRRCASVESDLRANGRSWRQAAAAGEIPSLWAQAKRR